MALKYEIDNRLKALAPVLDEHAEWFGRVMRRAFYPEISEAGNGLGIPEGFAVWSRDRAKTDFIDPETMAKLQALHHDLGEAAKVILETAVQTGQKPPVKAMDLFVDLYDEFVMSLRRLERDCILADSGIDSFTGLRSSTVLLNDLEVEMERLARRGKPFCIMMVRIDWYKYIKEGRGREGTELMEKAIAEMIKRVVRSYDDAYRLQNGEFIVVLKHADMSGSMAAVARMRRELDGREDFVEAEGRRHPVTLSYCLAEPVPGDDIRALLKHLANDLHKHIDDPDSVLQYYERSEIERYAHLIDDTKDQTAG